MIPSNAAELLGHNEHARHKGQKIDRSLINFVLTVLHSQQLLQNLEHEAPFTAEEIFSPALWEQLRRFERCQAGFCLSWLVDQGHAPFVKLKGRRNNRLTYRFSI